MGLAQRTPAPLIRDDNRQSGLDSFSESTRRSALGIREIVRSNGDESVFAFEKGRLTRGARAVPAVLVGSERAIHVIEYHSRGSAVCSYNRVVRFDTREGDGETAIGLSFYMGTTPVGERIAVGNGFEPSELANYRLVLPRTPDLAQVVRMIAAGTAAGGVPRHAHSVQPFV